MSRTIKLLKFKDIAHINESGVADIPKSRELMYKIIRAILSNMDCDIIIDIREWDITKVNRSLVFSNFVEIINEHKHLIKNRINKIATIIQDDPKRIEIAANIQKKIKKTGLSYRYFTNFEDLYNWLGEHDEYEI